MIQYLAYIFFLPGCFISALFVLLSHKCLLSLLSGAGTDLGISRGGGGGGRILKKYLKT